MRLTLLNKMLLLVSVPLCFEVTIFGVLINLQTQAEIEAQKVTRNKQINDCVNHILIYGISLARIRNNYKLSSFSTSNFKSDMRELTHNFDQLEKLTNYDPSLHQNVLDSRRSLFMAFDDLALIEKQLAASSPEQIPFLIAQSRRDLDVDVDQAKAAGIEELADRSLKGTDETRSRVLRERARTLLKFALALSVLTALFGVVMFSKHLANRLRRLGANAKRLGSGDALFPPEGGDDELARLEKSFHYAALLVARATKMRQEVANTITQELKTPLLIITEFFEKLHSNKVGMLNEQGDNLLSISEVESKRMLTLIDNMLELEKLRRGNEKLQLTNIKLVAFLDKSIDAIKILADEKNIAIKRDYVALTDDTIMGDAFWLEQVMVNLLSNAMKYSPRDSTVRVAVQRLASELCINISDQGDGIPANELDHIFDRFHRVAATQNKVKGSGLGLTISKELIELHQGSITVDSVLGKGSTFTVRLPRTKKESNTQRAMSTAGGAK